MIQPKIKKLRHFPPVVIVGAGGVASYLLAPLLKTLAHACLRAPYVTLVDGDILERRNLDRQLFHPDSIGENKAVALVNEHVDYYTFNGEKRLHAVGEFFTAGMRDLENGTLFLGAVDNHPARVAILQACDRLEGQAILMGNETSSAEAFYYLAEWRATPRDPREYFPELLTDLSGSPIRAIGCASEEALEAAPQSALANYEAAAFGLKLLAFWLMEAPGLDLEILEQNGPLKFSSNFARVTTTTTGAMPLTRPEAASEAA